ncbi:hypothetical protein GE061_006227 [Apolygus lucorum]|uniref:Major facilitator superfamily (MFS) profile domain-containing protein n=1 Tax=Apolygus lucorum TaxID=248454 RepID=A0A8S9WUP1_APOLU|nr:hypothetical protein GE061_006227 [Apolygus lucorum]
MVQSTGHDRSPSPKSGLSRQIIASAIVSMTSLIGGLGQGWNSPITMKLRTDDSPIGPMSKQEIANLLTLPSYVAFGLGFSFIYFINRFGRKPVMVITTIPCCAGYLILAFANSETMLYVGKIVSMISLGGMSCGQMYVSEVTHESIRGVMLSVCTLQINVGILLSYTLGKWLNYKWFNVVLSITPAILGVLVSFLPETPPFLVGKSRYEDAKKSLVWFKGGDVSLAESELEIIKESSQSEDKTETTLMQEMKQRASKIALIVGFLGYFLQTASGIHAVVNYAGIIFEEAGSPLSADDSSIVTAVLNLAASFVNLFLIDIFGRKILLYISFIGGSISLAVLSVFLYINERTEMDASHFGWIPIASLSIFIFTYGIGLASVPGILLNELTPTKVKAVLVSFVMIICLIFVLGIVQTFPFVDDNFGLYTCFAVPAACNVMGLFYTAFLVPETRGKSLTVIADELNRKNRHENEEE